MDRWCVALIAFAAIMVAGVMVAEADGSDADNAVSDTKEYNFSFSVTDGDKGLSDAPIKLYTVYYDSKNSRLVIENKASCTTDGSGEADCKISLSSEDVENLYAVFGSKNGGYTVIYAKDSGGSDIGSYTVIDDDLECVGPDAAVGNYVKIGDLVDPDAPSEAGINVTMKKTVFTSKICDCNYRGLKNITVSAVDPFGIKTESKTDADGNFTIGIGSNYGMKFTIGNMPGYTAIEFEPYAKISGSTMILGVSGKFEYADGKPWITMPQKSDAAGTVIYSYSKQITMVKTEGNLSITVLMPGGDPIDQAEITIVNKSTYDSVTKSTNSEGKAEFTVPTGDYYYRSLVGGFKNYDSRDDGLYITVSVDKPAAEVLTLEEKTSPTYFGLNTGHILMLTGIAVGAVLALLSYLLYTRRLHSELVENDDAD